jgi:hypothetical protein
MRLYQYGMTDLAMNGYGMSPVEQVVRAVESVLMASTHNHAYFSNSKVPPGILDLGVNATKADVQEFRALWEMEMRDPHRIPIIGGGFSVPAGQRQQGRVEWVQFNQHSNKEMQYLEYLNWLYKVVCAVMLASPEEIGFESGGAYKGDGGLNKSDKTDTGRRAGKDKGLIPLMELLANQYTDLLEWSDFHDYEFHWMGMEDQDKLEAAQIITANTEAGLYAPMPTDTLETFNEKRKDSGKEPWDEAKWERYQQKAQEQQANQMAMQTAMGGDKGGENGKAGGGGPEGEGPGGDKGPIPGPSQSGAAASRPTPKPDQWGGWLKKSVQEARVRHIGRHEWRENPEPALRDIEDELTDYFVGVTHDLVQELFGVVSMHKALFDDPDALRSVERRGIEALTAPSGSPGLRKLTLAEVEEIVDRYMNPILISAKGQKYVQDALSRVQGGIYTAPDGTKVPVLPRHLNRRDPLEKLWLVTQSIAAQDMRRAGIIGPRWGMTPNQSELDFYRSYAFDEIKGQAQKVKSQVRKAFLEARAQGDNPYAFERNMAKATGDWETDWRRIAVTETARAQSKTSFTALKELGETHCYFADIPGQCAQCAQHIAGKVFAISDIEARTNFSQPQRNWGPAIPMHPNCRHRPMPVPGGILPGSRVAKPASEGAAVALVVKNTI